MPPHTFEGEGPLGALHRFVYPPNSKFYWYRRGKVRRRPLTLKYARFLLLCLVSASAGSGTLMFGCMLALTAVMQEFDAWKQGRPGPWAAALGFSLTSGGPAAGAAESVSAAGALAANGSSVAQLLANASETAQCALDQSAPLPDYFARAMADPVFTLTWMVMAGLSTLIIYYASASAIHNEFYVRQRDRAKEWKCQQTFPSDALLREEKLTGCFNAFMAGFAGLGLFFLHQNRPFLKLYFSAGARGWGHFVGGCVLVFLWVEVYSYWMHRLLHHKLIYKYVHKWHHRYKQPTAFGAFALHPLEYTAFQTAGVWCCAVFPVHVMSFLTVATFVAFHNQVDHSGIYFEGDLPWVASTKFHDDHHKYFHVNYGVTMVFWDWLFGSLRQSDRVYSEDIFQGQHDAAAAKVKSS